MAKKTTNKLHRNEWQVNRPTASPRQSSLADPDEKGNAMSREAKVENTRPWGRERAWSSLINH